MRIRSCARWSLISASTRRCCRTPSAENFEACPIALHAACSSAERIAFRQINKATGNRLRQQLIDEETREPVAPEHKGRGYEVAKGQYLIVEEAELEAIEIESTHTIEIDSFVPRSRIDQRFFDTPYYVMPSEPVDRQGESATLFT